MSRCTADAALLLLACLENARESARREDRAFDNRRVNSIMKFYAMAVPKEPCAVGPPFFAPLTSNTCVTDAALKERGAVRSRYSA